MQSSDSETNGHRGSRSTAVQLLSSVDGEITQVLLTEAGYSTPYSGKPLEAIKTAYKNAGIDVFEFQNTMDAQRKVQRNTPSFARLDFDDPLVEEFLQRGRSGTITAKIDPYLILKDLNAIQEKKFSIVQSEWAQDNFLIKTGPENWGIILQPVLTSRPEDQFVADELTMNSDLHLLLQKTDLKFEGGNILGGENFALIGKNTLAINWIDRLKNSSGTKRDLDLLKEEFRKLEMQFSRDLGVGEVIWVGFDAPRPDLFDQRRLSFQPDYHLDLFLTLGGKTASGRHLIFVADPRLGKELAEAATSEKVVYGLQWDAEDISDSMIAQQFDDMVRFFETDNINSSIQFEVKRVPMLISGGVVYSFNNAIVDIVGHRKRIFLPNYCEEGNSFYLKGKHAKILNKQLRALATTAENIYSYAGFDQVIPTGDGFQMKNYARRRGSLHCLTKVLRRRTS